MPFQESPGKVNLDVKVYMGRLDEVRPGVRVGVNRTNVSHRVTAVETDESLVSTVK